MNEGRSPAFYALAAFFALFVLFLYGPMIVIFILSFQGPTGGLTFPMNGFGFPKCSNLLSFSHNLKLVASANVLYGAGFFQFPRADASVIDPFYIKTKSSSPSQISFFFPC